MWGKGLPKPFPPSDRVNRHWPPAFFMPNDLENSNMAAEEGKSQCLMPIKVDKSSPGFIPKTSNLICSLWHLLAK